MNRYFASLTVALFALLLSASNAAAQLGFNFGVGGGPSFPLSELGEEADTGFHLQASLGLTGFPVEVRADGIFQRFTEEDGGWIRGIGGLGNVFLPLPLGGAAPYVIAGLGFLHTEDEHEHREPATELAFGLGGGVRFGALGRFAFVEARYLDAGEHHRAVPITLGIAF